MVCEVLGHDITVRADQLLVWPSFLTQSFNNNYKNVNFTRLGRTRLETNAATANE